MDTIDETRKNFDGDKMEEYDKLLEKLVGNYNDGTTGWCLLAPIIGRYA
jgi:hypothetical protein